MKRAATYGVLAVLALILAGLIAPFIRADQYREQIRDGLQRALRRKVDIHGNTRLNLFHGPGFSIEKVVIHEDPSVGLEPFANVPELQASVRLSSLWTGRLDFAKIRFVEPSLNIVKPDQGTWNITPLLAGAAAQKSVRLPELQVSDGRLNFKFGDLKSAFYLTDVDLDVWPSRDGLDIRFSVAPARTDRAGQGYGQFTGQGRWAAGKIDLDVELERSSVTELVTLARGEALGLHGRLASRARLSGPVTNIEIRGRFDLEDVHRWDLIQGRTGSLAMSYHGTFDFGAQRLELVADNALNPDVPLALKLVIADILYNPNWTAEVALNRLPASALVEVARDMGAPLPQGLAVEGLAGGVIAYTSSPGVQGQISIDDAVVRLERGPEFHLRHASVLLSGDEITLQPALLSGPSRAAQLQATYAPFRQQLKARITGKRLPITDLQNGPGHLLNGASVPVLDRFKGGTWTGALAYVSDGARRPAWSAKLQIEDTSVAVPGIAGPVEILTADLEMEGERIALRGIRGRAANADIFGDYRFLSGAERPHRFALSIPSVDVDSIEQALLPTIRRDTNFFARTLRFRNSTAPEWLRTRRAEGTIRIGTLTAGDHSFRAVRARVVWNGALLQFPAITARLEDAAIQAAITADLAQFEPRYKLTGTIENLNWRGGHLDLQGSAETRGLGIGLVANLNAAGEYQIRSVPISPEFPLNTASGTFDLALSRVGPQLKLAVTEAMVGSDRYAGEGATRADGLLYIDLASGPRVVRLAGPFSQLKLEVPAERVPR